MVGLWFAILWLTFTMFAVFGGWDFGAGAPHFPWLRRNQKRTGHAHRRDRTAVDLE